MPDAPHKGRAQRGLLFHVLSFGLFAYLIAVVPALLLTGWVGEGWRPLAFYNTFAHLLWLVAFGLWPLALLLRRWGFAALLLLPIAAFLLAYGPRWLPRSAPDQAAATTVSVVSYNLLWERSDNAQRIAVIAALDADIVALQELGPRAAAAIEAQLAAAYPYQALHPQRFGIDGHGILSRYPILSSTYWQAQGVIGAQRAEVALAEDEMIVIHNVHPKHPGLGNGFFDPQVRSRGIDQIMARAARDTGQPVLLLGDFNMPDLSDDYQRVAADYSDSFAQMGRGLGLTYEWDGLPLLRLDYIFASADFVTHAASVWPDSGGSDHRPVVAMVTLR